MNKVLHKTSYDYYYYSLYRLLVVRYKQQTLTLGGNHKDCKSNDKNKQKVFLLNLKS